MSSQCHSPHAGDRRGVATSPCWSEPIPACSELCAHVGFFGSVGSAAQDQKAISIWLEHPNHDRQGNIMCAHVHPSLSSFRWCITCNALSAGNQAEFWGNRPRFLAFGVVVGGGCGVGGIVAQAVWLGRGGAGGEWRARDRLGVD